MGNFQITGTVPQLNETESIEVEAKPGEIHNSSDVDSYKSVRQSSQGFEMIKLEAAFD